MRKSVSAPNLLIPKVRNHFQSNNKISSPRTNYPIVYNMIKLTHCRTLITSKQIIVISATAMMGYANYTNRIDLQYLSNTVISFTCMINMLFSFIENYTLQLDRWRDEESTYEEKTEPPLWNWKIVNVCEHTSIVLWLCGALLEDVSMYNTRILHIAFVTQIIALGFNVFDSNTIIKSIKASFCVGSLICFLVYKNTNDLQYLLLGTLCGIVSEFFFFL